MIRTFGSSSNWVVRSHKAMNVHRAPPSRRGRSEGGDPHHAIGLTRRNEPLGVKTPRIVDRDAGANPVRIGKPVVHPQAAKTPTPLSGAAKGNVEKRVVSFKSRTSPCSISISSGPRPPAVQTATPKRAPFTTLASVSSADKGSCVCATGRPLTRARNEARLAASVVPTPMVTTSISPLKPEILAWACGASHTMRRATSTPSGLASGRNSRSFRVGQASVKPSPTSSTTSARTRASPGVVSMTPVSRRQLRSRNIAAECICSTTPPTPWRLRWPPWPRRDPYQAQQ